MLLQVHLKHTLFFVLIFFKMFFVATVLRKCKTQSFQMAARVCFLSSLGKLAQVCRIKLAKNTTSSDLSSVIRWVFFDVHFFFSCYAVAFLIFVHAARLYGRGICTDEPTDFWQSRTLGFRIRPLRIVCIIQEGWPAAIWQSGNRRKITLTYSPDVGRGG